MLKIVKVGLLLLLVQNGKTVEQFYLESVVLTQPYIPDIVIFSS